jgi:hypothetical protein
MTSDYLKELEKERDDPYTKLERVFLCNAEIEGYKKGCKDTEDKILKIINEFNFGYDYNRDCQIKERLLKELSKGEDEK